LAVFSPFEKVGGKTIGAVSENIVSSPLSWFSLRLINHRLTREICKFSNTESEYQSQMLFLVSQEIMFSWDIQPIIASASI
jgi:hypothetical protein